MEREDLDALVERAERWVRHNDTHGLVDDLLAALHSERRKLEIANRIIQRVLPEAMESLKSDLAALSLPAPDPEERDRG